MSDKERMDTTEDDQVKVKNDEGDSADVEGHQLKTKVHGQTEDGEDDGTPDVEGHRNTPRGHL